MTLQTIFRLFLGLCLLATLSCAQIQKSPSAITNRAFDSELKFPQLSSKIAFVSHPDWLALTLDYTGFAELYRKINQRQALPLKNRGEAHITILTPPEFKSFQGQIPMSEIESLFQERIKNATFEIVCVGKGKLKSPSDLQTFFVVVKSHDLLQIRQAIKQLANKHKVGSEFNPDEFYPHITIGFTERDLHLADAVRKDQSSCLPQE